MVSVCGQIARFAEQLHDSATDLLLPPRCARCGVDIDAGSDPLVCHDCRDQLTAGGDSFCHRCGAWLPPGRDVSAKCAQCGQTRFGFDDVIPLGPYRDALREAVLDMKRPAGEALSAAIAGLLAARRGGLLEQFQADCLMPIPMFWGRRIHRRMNSAAVLAEELGRRLGILVVRNAIYRRRNTFPQKDLGPIERFRNVRGAFGLRGGYLLEGARVAIVDDILTTGATCSEVAKTLKKAKVAAVAAVVVGRAGLDTAGG